MLVVWKLDRLGRSLSHLLKVVGAYLAAAGEGYAMPTLRRRVAAIARACGVAGHQAPRHPRNAAGIGRKHGAPARKAAALTTTEIRKLSRACGTDLAGARDRALFLVGFAGALRRSELIGLDVAHVTWTDVGVAGMGVSPLALHQPG